MSIHILEDNLIDQDNIHPEMVKIIVDQSECLVCLIKFQTRLTAISCKECEKIICLICMDKFLKSGKNKKRNIRKSKIS